jgi:peptidoglycan biosynthesis protein MviN/MurJ (putative lipid II flippase)
MFPLGVFNAAVNLLGDSILVRFFGVRGILLSTATTHTAVVVVLYLLLQRTLRERRVPAQGHP